MPKHTGNTAPPPRDYRAPGFNKVESGGIETFSVISALAFGLSNGTHPLIGVTDCAQDGIAVRNTTAAKAATKLDFMTIP
jgi:hypothetical protein